VKTECGKFVLVHSCKYPIWKRVKINFCSNIRLKNERIKSLRGVDIDLIESIVINLLFVNIHPLFHVVGTRYFNALC